ncbi:MAG: hypothetical protein MJ241_01120 [Bacilli bacterium]|nr:hypothetical protein [Bacilli bacterium]
MTYEVRLTIYIVAAIIVGGLLIAWFLYTPIKNWLWRHRTPEMFYKKVLKVANDFDFYLVNNIKVKSGTRAIGVINHIIGGDKYLYLISECYFNGVVEARSDDKIWVFYSKDGKKSDFRNQIQVNNDIINAFCMSTSISKSFIRGIVIINDDCFVQRLDSGVGETILVPVSKLEYVIKKYEEDDVKPFSDSTLKQVIWDLHDSNTVGEEK